MGCFYCGVADASNPKGFDPLTYKPHQMFSSYSLAEQDSGAVFVILDDYVIVETKSDFLGVTGVMASAAEIIKQQQQDKRTGKKDDTKLTADQKAYAEQNSSEAAARGGHVLNKKQKKPVEEAAFEKVNKQEIQDGHYLYTIPEDKCYTLENGYTFCVKEGKITKKIKDRDPELKYIKDPFFYQKDERCKIAKFLFIYNFIIKKRAIAFHQYQMNPVYYPEFIRLIVLNKQDLIMPWYIEHKDLSGKPTRVPYHDSVALFSSSKMDCGCVPYKGIKLFNDVEASLNKLHSPSYLLTGEWDKKKDSGKNLLMTLDGPVVTKYNLRVLQLVSDSSIIEFNPPKYEPTASDMLNRLSGKASKASASAKAGMVNMKETIISKKDGIMSSDDEKKPDAKSDSAPSSAAAIWGSPPKK